MKAGIAGSLANAALLLASLLAGLLLCEAGLRLFHPKYAHLAEAVFIRDPNLLYARIPSHCSFHRHPDTRELHSFCHNSLGFRQHREFSAADLESSINIAFFGDSFVENVNLEAQLSFTEPLDHLLNLKGSGISREGEKVNVLNFGVHGYGTAQSLLRYERWNFRETLDHVFYVYSKTDPKNDLASGLFRLDAEGRLARGEASPSRFALLSKLHLSYLALDAAGRLSTHLGKLADKAARLRSEYMRRQGHYEHEAEVGPGLPQSAFDLFRQLLCRFKAAAESSGASFHLLWLPMEDYDSPGVAAIVEEEGVATLSLRDCFGERDPAHLRTPWRVSPYRFQRNDHWNEAGNRLAAVCLHRFLADRLGLPGLSEAEVAQALDLYYSAFEAPAEAGEGGRSAAPMAAAIRKKYEAPAEGDWAGLRVRAPWTPSPDKLAVRSRFDIYLHDGWLAYVKEGCAPADFRRRFFLHLRPADVRDLPPERRAHGFDNLDFWGRGDQATCTAWRKLPGYAIERIATGQLSMHLDGHGSPQVLWEAEHVLSKS